MNKYLWGLLTVALFFSLLVIGWRIDFERHNSIVEMVVDYDDLVKLESISGQKINHILEQFQQTGILSVAVSEDTLQKLSETGKVTIISGEDLLNNSRIGQAPSYLVTRLVRRALIVAGRQYIIIDEDNLFRRTKTSLIDEYGKQIVTEVGDKVLEIKGNPADFRNIGLGLDTSVVSLLNRKGFNVIPRILPATNLSDVAIGLKIDRIFDSTKATTVIFSGNEVLGANQNLETVINKLKEKKVNIGIIEFNKQKGLKQIAKSLPSGQSVRVHSIMPKQLQQLNAQTAVERFSLAVNERGIRLIYLHPYLNEHEDLLVKNIDYFQNLQKQLLNKGFQLQQVGQREFTAISYNNLIIFLVSLSVVVFAFLFLRIYFPKIFPQVQFILTALLILSFYFFYKINDLNFYRNLMALILSITTPVIAMIYCLPDDFLWKKISKQKKVWQIIKTVLKMFGLTILGIVFISALLSDPYYMLKVRQFLGVKLAYLLPPLLIGFYYLFYPNKIKAARFVLRRFLDIPITLRQVLILGFLTIFLTVYLVRSGNFSLPLIDWEINMRRLLMDIFVIRPRTKEFLIGYPLIVLLLYCLNVAYSFKWILAALGSVALSSLVNTFLHIHSPFMISVWRSFNGLFLGVLLGLVLILIINITKKIYRAFIF